MTKRSVSMTYIYRIKGPGEQVKKSGRTVIKTAGSESMAIIGAKHILKEKLARENKILVDVKLAKII